MRPLFVPKIPRVWVALLRVMVGLVFLTVVYSNYYKGYYSPQGLQVFFTQVFPQSENPFPWYANFIENVVLPLRGPFSTFQLITEPLLGLALLFGVFTPVASLGAMFFILNTFLATFGQDWPWSYLMIEGILFVVLVTQAGRSLGVDGWLTWRFGKDRWYLW